MKIILFMYNLICKYANRTLHNSDEAYMLNCR